MRTLDTIFFIVLVLGLSAAVYILWINAPQPIKDYGSFTSNITSFTISNESQFFPNMRYKDRIISYQISDSCSTGKVSDIERAFNILSDKTILSFYSSGTGEIQILCSNVAPTSKEKNHFIAGEGGPAEVVNTSYYWVILSGKVSLYRSERCETPQIAIHEILHTLGFEHKINPDSILYPVTSCEQEIDQNIIDEINKLYKVDSLIDLGIEKVNANKQGAYVNFNITIENYGLKDSERSKLTISTEKGAVKDFEVGSLTIGTKREISVQNLRVESNANTLLFTIESSENELSLINNQARISLLV
jgi:hypothetical protein